MLRHRLATYKDGYKDISFCEICSAEGEKLFSECVGIEDDPLKEKIKNIWKEVDKLKLRD